MFCRYCGKEIQSPGDICENCGKKQKELQCTNGYFGILEVIDGPPKATLNQESTSGIEHGTKSEEDVQQERIYFQKQIKKYEKKIKHLESYLLSIKKAFLITVIIIVFLIVILFIIGILWLISISGIERQTSGRDVAISVNMPETGSDSVSDDEMVLVNTTVSGNSTESEKTAESGNASVSGNTLVSGNGTTSENTADERKESVSDNYIKEEVSISENLPRTGIDSKNRAPKER